MQQNLVFVMSLAGTMVYLLYILTYFAAQKYFAAQWRYLILKISLVFFLIPFPYYKPMIRMFVESVFPFLRSETAWNGVPFMDEFNVIIKTSEGMFLSANLKKVFFLACIIGILSLAIISVQFFRYIKTRRICLNNGVNLPPSFLLEKLKDIKENMGIKTTIKIIMSELCQQPMVIGVFKPIIVIPLFNINEIEEQEWDYILRHELVHIKHKDLLTKFIGLFVMAIHWFNPICYLLFREISIISEICCDDCVLTGNDVTDRKKYCHFIVSLASEDKLLANNIFSASLLNNDLHAIKRRILEMRASKKIGKKVLSYFICGVICVMGAVTAFAYEAPVIMEIADGQEFILNDDIKFTADIYMEDEFFRMPYDSFFTYENGSIIEIAKGQSSPKAGCIHSFVSGTYTDHERNSDGGCKTLYYRAKICAYCNYMIRGELYSTQTYVSCPH